MHSTKHIQLHFFMIVVQVHVLTFYFIGAISFRSEWRILHMAIM